MQRPPSPRVRARDAGLVLAARLRRWLIGGAIVLTGLLSVVAGRSFGGRTARASAASLPSGSATSNATASASSGASSPSAPDDGSALQPPAQAPVPAPVAPAPVVSGGS